MKFGFSLPHSGPTSRPRELSTIAEHAEKLGFDYLIESSDHIVVPEKIDSMYPYSQSGKYTDSPEDLEQLSTIAFLASKVQRARILSAVMVLPYRPAILTAKILATIDYLSNGRLTVGVGIGWLKEEFNVLGIPFESRGRIADEYIRAFHKLWLGQPATFEGRFCNFVDVKLTPRTVQRPHPPIWVGGESEAAMKRAAWLGDAWLPIGTNPNHPLNNLERLREAVQKFRRYVREAGRSIENVGIGYMVSKYALNDGSSGNNGLFVGSAKKIVMNIKELESIGVSFLGFSLQEETVEKTMASADKFASEIMSEVRDGERGPS